MGPKAFGMALDPKSPQLGLPGVVRKTWTMSLSFGGSSTASYALTGVPLDTASLSAKTEWNLRRKLGVSFTNTAAVAHFAGLKLLPAGDLDNSNTVSRDLLSAEAIAATGRPQKKPQARQPAPAGRKLPWPKALSERVQAVETALHAAGRPTTAADLAQQFLRAKPADVEEILKTLATLGRAHRTQDGQFAP